MLRLNWAGVQGGINRWITDPTWRSVGGRSSTAGPADSGLVKVGSQFAGYRPAARPEPQAGTTSVLPAR